MGRRDGVDPRPQARPRRRRRSSPPRSSWPTPTGLAAVSMRKVAERLGRSAMALYTYVPGKAELLDLMLDTVYGEQPAPDPTDGRLARRRRGVGGRHLGLLPPPSVGAAGRRRPPRARPPRARRLRGAAAHLRRRRPAGGRGRPLGERPRRVRARRGARRCPTPAPPSRRPGVSDDDWWNARSPLLDEMVGDAGRRATRVDAPRRRAGVRPGRPPDDSLPYTVRDAFDTFEFGLQRLLDGFAAHIAAVGDS